MAEDWQSRTELLLTIEGTKKLSEAHVLIAGLGGVGAYVAELICRAGIGKMTIVDSDIVQPSNRNRQLPALKSTEGRSKVDLVAERLLDINPNLELNTHNKYLKDETIHEVLNQNYDYVVDAIDTLSPKVFFIYHVMNKGFKLVSSMGAGGKIDPSQIKIEDLSKTSTCKLAYYIRKHLHKLGIYTGFKVVFSTEPVNKDAIELTDGNNNKKSTVGTVSYMPALFGCMCASVVIRELAGN